MSITEYDIHDELIQKECIRLHTHIRYRILQDLFLAEQINKRNMKKEVQYLLDHKLSIYELECAYRAKGYLG